MMRAVLAAASLVCFACPVQAADPAPLADPTRPPAAASAEGAAAAEAEVKEMRLSTVLLPQGGKPSVVIDGQVVMLGEKVGEARLIRVRESEAVLQGPDGIEHLYLTPDVDKKINVTRTAPRRTKDKT